MNFLGAQLRHFDNNFSDLQFGDFETKLVDLNSHAATPRTWDGFAVSSRMSPEERLINFACNVIYIIEESVQHFRRNFAAATGAVAVLREADGIGGISHG